MIIRTVSLMAVFPAVVFSQLQFEVVKLHEDNNEGCAVADYNQDGLLDISAGGFWYAAPDWQQRPVRELGAFGDDYTSNNGEHAVDVNGDGWLDILAGTFKEGPVSWYRNPGKDAHDSGEMWEKQDLIDSEVTANEATFFYDIDGDGAEEFITNSWITKNPFRVYPLADGMMTMATIGESSPISNGHGAGFGDIDGDGREDVVYGNGWYRQPDANPMGQEWQRHPDFTLPHASCPILVVDVNGDGRNDIIWGDGHNYGLYWEEQKAADPDGTTNWRTHLIDKKISQFHAMELIDLDGDGAPELVTGKRYKGHSGKDMGADDPIQIVYYKWSVGGEGFKKHIAHEGQVGTGLQIRSGDMDGNGLVDLVTAGKSGTYILLNRGVLEKK